MIKFYLLIKQKKNWWLYGHIIMKKVFSSFAIKKSEKFCACQIWEIYSGFYNPIYSCSCMFIYILKHCISQHEMGVNEKGRIFHWLTNEYSNLNLKKARCVWVAKTSFNSSLYFSLRSSAQQYMYACFYMVNIYIYPTHNDEQLCKWEKWKIVSTLWVRSFS